LFIAGAGHDLKSVVTGSVVERFGEFFSLT